jgi:ribose transport system substrate-binding protein
MVNRHVGFQLRISGGAIHMSQNNTKRSTMNGLTPDHRLAQVFWALVSITCSSLCSGAVAQEPKTFAIVVPYPGAPFFDSLVASYGSSARESAVEYIEIRPQDPQQMAAHLDDLVARGDVDGIAVWPIDAGIADAARRVTASDIPLVTIGNDLQDTGRITFVGTDQYTLGKALGEIASYLQPAGGEYAVVGDDGSQLTSERLGGVYAGLSENWTRVDLQTDMTIGANSGSDALISLVPLQDALAMGDVQVAVPDDLLVVAAENGGPATADAVVVETPDPLGTAAFEALLSISAGESQEDFTPVLGFVIHGVGDDGPIEYPSFCRICGCCPASD